MTVANSDAAHCADLVRASDYDRYANVLFAPIAARDALLALFAFNVEVSGVADHVTQPLAGEIRLQWWDDALSGKVAAEAQGNPVAAEMLAAIDRHGLSAVRLRELIAGHRFDLYDEPMQTVAELEAYLGQTVGELFALGAEILGEQSSRLSPLMHHASLAHGLLTLVESLPRHAARRRLYLPLELLDRFGVSNEIIFSGQAPPELCALTRSLAESVASERAEALALLPDIALSTRANFLLLALLPARLRRLERAGYDPFRLPVASRLSRLWTLWRASRAFGRL